MGDNPAWCIPRLSPMNDDAFESPALAGSPAPSVPSAHASAPRGRPYAAEGRGERSGHGGHRGGRPAVERVVALVDGRFWWWLQDQSAPQGTDVPAELPQQLEHLIRRSARSDLIRTYWYTDQASAERVPGVVPRAVPANAQDGGVAMLRLMAHDLQQIAERRSADRVLLVSDDERLILAVDHAQHHGLSVDMLIDEEAQDAQRLKEEDPCWARLLNLADRLVVLGDAQPQAQPHRRSAGDVRSAGDNRRDAAGPREMGAHREARVAASPQAIELIESEVSQWWAEENESTRQHWREEVQTTRGIPQELDRQLLLRVSRQMGQALSPAEKSAMRASVRRRITEGEAPGAAAMTQPADA